MCARTRTQRASLLIRDPALGGRTESSPPLPDRSAKVTMEPGISPIRPMDGKGCQAVVSNVSGSSFQMLLSAAVPSGRRRASDGSS